MQIFWFKTVFETNIINNKNTFVSMDLWLQ